MAVVYGVPADSPRIWLTYLQRPIALLRCYGKGTWGALRGDPASRAAWEREAWLEHWLRGGEATDRRIYLVSIHLLIRSPSAAAAIPASRPGWESNA